MITDSKTENVTFKRKFKRTYQRSLLWLIGLLFPVRTNNNPIENPKDILIFVQEKLGDAILLTPLIKNLKIIFPDIRVHLVIFHKQSDIFNDDPKVFKVHNFKKDKLGVARALKKQHFDILFNTKDHPSFTFIMLGRYLNARYKVGIDHKFHRNHYVRLLKADMMEHTIEKICVLFSIWDIPLSNLQLQPYMPPAPISDEVASFAGQLEDKVYVGINLSAGSREKEWPAEKWGRLMQHSDERFIVFAVGESLADKSTLEADYKNVLKSPETKNINEAATIVQKLKMLLTPSTGLLHVASCYDIPVVGLFRHDASDHLRFAPYSSQYEKAIAENHIVANIPVENVEEAVQRLKNKNGNKENIGH